MKKLMFLAAMMALALMAIAPAVLAQVIEDEIGQEAESGDAEGEIEISGEGSSSNSCVPVVQGSQTGGNQGGQTFTQYTSAAEDIEIEGGGIEQSPESENECVQEIQQAASAGKATPKAEGKAPAPAPAPAPKPPASAPTPKPPAPKPEEKKEVAKKEEKKELPKTGGSGSASLLALGAGALLIGGGLLVRRIVR